MAPGRVCHISTVHIPFDQRIFYRECWTLAQAGYDTHLLVQLDERETCQDGVHLHSVGKRRPNRPGLRLLRRLRRFGKALQVSQQLKADIYHLHDPELILLGLWLKIGRKATVIFDAHEDYTSFIEHKNLKGAWLQSLLVRLMRLLERSAARFFDAIVTADQGVADLYGDRYGAHMVTVLHNFPRLGLFLKSDQKAPIEKRYDLVYHGTIGTYHLQAAFDVAERLRSRGLSATWLFFGRFHATEWAQAELERRGLTDNFTIDAQLIPHDQVPQRIQQARIGFIPLPDWPKFRKNIPTKLFEFMALGLPVVLGDLPPTRPFVGDGECGISVRASDFDAYADAIARLLTDEPLRQRMGQAGEERVRTSLNWEREAGKLLSLYEELQSLHGSKQ